MCVWGFFGRRHTKKPAAAEGAQPTADSRPSSKKVAAPKPSPWLTRSTAIRGTGDPPDNPFTKRVLNYAIAAVAVAFVGVTIVVVIRDLQPKIGEPFYEGWRVRDSSAGSRSRTDGGNESPRVSSSPRGRGHARPGAARAVQGGSRRTPGAAQASSRRRGPPGRTRRTRTSPRGPPFARRERPAGSAAGRPSRRRRRLRAGARTYTQVARAGLAQGARCVGGVGAAVVECVLDPRESKRLRHAPRSVFFGAQRFLPTARRRTRTGRISHLGRVIAAASWLLRPPCGQGQVPCEFCDLSSRRRRRGTPSR